VSDTDILHRLCATIAARRDAPSESSYVAALQAKGLDAMLKKVGEEATEFVMAAKDGDPQHLTREAADLWFHSLLVLSHFGLGAADILGELGRREGVSGLSEKASRGKGGQ
jgi:phosphoribosyl-ATP pyrophosphohydrolase